MSRGRARRVSVLCDEGQSETDQNVDEPAAKPGDDRQQHRGQTVLHTYDRASFRPTSDSDAERRSPANAPFIGPSGLTLGCDSRLRHSPNARETGGTVSEASLVPIVGAQAGRTSWNATHPSLFEPGRCPSRRPDPTSSRRSSFRHDCALVNHPATLHPPVGWNVKGVSRIYCLQSEEEEQPPRSTSVRPTRFLRARLAASPTGTRLKRVSSLQSPVGPGTFLGYDRVR